MTEVQALSIRTDPAVWSTHRCSLAGKGAVYILLVQGGVMSWVCLLLEPWRCVSRAWLGLGTVKCTEQ
jgi:hypothetical protein